MRIQEIVSEESGESIADDQVLWEMSNIFPKNSGLSMVIWVSARGGAQHGCRIKVGSTSDVEFTVTVPDLKIVGKQSCSNKDLQKVFEFIQRNQAALLELWNMQIDFVDFVHVMQRV